MNIKKINVNELHMPNYNPRKQLKAGDAEYEKLKRSIETYGYVEPIIFNSRSGYIVGGNQRLQVLIDLGESEVECVVVDLSESEEKSLNIALNKINGEWDLAKLEDLLRELEISNADLTLTGFDVDELNDLLFSDAILDAAENMIPEIETDNVITKTGDIWTLGKHKLLCGDCTDENAMAQFFKGNTIDMLLTDPPYGVDYHGARNIREPIKNDNLSDIAFAKFLKQAFANIKPHLKQGAAFYIWYASMRSGIFQQAITERLGEVRQVLIWAKPHFVLSRQDYQWAHEPCFYGWTEGAKHYFVNRKQRTMLSDIVSLENLSPKDLQDLLQSTIISASKPNKSEEHPTMKPLTIFEKLIRNSTRESETVADIFAGSGTTLIACEKLNRRCLAVELAPTYCDLIVRRYVQLGKTEICLNGQPFKFS